MLIRGIWADVDAESEDEALRKLQEALDGIERASGIRLLLEGAEAADQGDFRCPDPAGADCHDDRCSLHYGEWGEEDD